MTITFKCLCFIFLLFQFMFYTVQCTLNDRPIIGIIAEETDGLNKSSTFGKSLITASYVKFLETGGARVVPIMIRKPREYYEDLLSKINGVLFPGGGDVLTKDGYGRTGRIIFDIAVKLNDKNDYFPIWGTCLGFELMNYVVAKQKLWMTACSAEDLTSNLNFVTDVSKSRMYSKADVALLNAMTNENVTINYHQWCLTYQNYTLSGLDKYFKVLSTGRDMRNLTYISSVEAYNYPFYGVAFHPEKVLFEWSSSRKHKNIPHTNNATRVSQYFANFFVNEARKNLHRFPTNEEENEVLIYNFQPVFTGKLNMSVEQNYYFQ